MNDSVLEFQKVSIEITPQEPINICIDTEKIESNKIIKEEETLDKLILSKLQNKEMIFEVVIDKSDKEEIKKPKNPKKIHDVNSSIKENLNPDLIDKVEDNLNNININNAIKPTNVKLNPTHNSPRSNIIINNFINIYNPNFNDPSSAMALVQNITQKFPNVETEKNFLIINNAQKEDTPQEENIVKSKIYYIYIYLFFKLFLYIEKKGRPRKNAEKEINNNNSNSNNQ